MNKSTIHTGSKYFTLVIAILAATVGLLVTRQITLDATTNSTISNCPDTCVYLKADKAEPDTLTVKVGEYVQFNSADGKAHSLSLGLGGTEHEHKGQYNSGEFQADEAWRVQFRQPGSFTFHDHYNPNINILVVAYEERKQPASNF